ncbi:hypothetical protein [Paracoccus zhejiangensis]|uniref:Uncharacterized protein n=1 Tax=Paracoccus zhejiangensis TaxID=1077935 RepID=A0A2H5F2S1_9RHOB|nr:hypothetical protein [Paracoccus zhejiangensis]AUH65836.1 hypothetical protein CX676_18120 [Paracoccus zhejiangensis]
MAETGTLDADHRKLDDDLQARAFIDQTRHIAEVLPGALDEMVRDGLFTQVETEVIDGYLGALKASMDALAMKYLVAGRIEGPLQRHLTIDIHESGFPVWQEIAQTAADAAQAQAELARTPDAAAIKDDMVREIVGRQTIPTRLQYALSQRYYYEALATGGLFWPQMHPQGFWLSGHDSSRRRWLLHWAVYDSQLNVPILYLMDVDDTGRRALTDDPKRWPEVRAHLLAQSVSGLQLLTIAQGFDRDFETLHPHRLRRITLGPAYSSGYTVQEGPIREVLDSAAAPAGEDWALAMTVEDLQAERAVMESTGFFGVTERQIFKLDPLNQYGAGQGATSATRLLVLPARPYQALATLDPPGFRNIRKYVPGPDGRVTSYR